MITKLIHAWWRRQKRQKIGDTAAMLQRVASPEGREQQIMQLARMRDLTPWEWNDLPRFRQKELEREGLDPRIKS